MSAIKEKDKDFLGYIVQQLDPKISKLSHDELYNLARSFVIYLK